MTHPPYTVGYGRPPERTRFRKGQSGNPGGRPGPKKLFKRQFDAALYRTLNGDLESLQQAKPANIVESLARQIVLQAAVEGRTSAQKLVLALLDREDEIAPGEDARPEERRAEFEACLAAAVESGSVEDILAVTEAFKDVADFPEAGNFSGNSENIATPASRAWTDWVRSVEAGSNADDRGAAAPRRAGAQFPGAQFPGAQFPEAGNFSGNLEKTPRHRTGGGIAREAVRPATGCGGAVAHGAPPNSLKQGNSQGI